MRHSRARTWRWIANRAALLGLPTGIDLKDPAGSLVVSGGALRIPFAEVVGAKRRTIARRLERFKADCERRVRALPKPQRRGGFIDMHGRWVSNRRSRRRTARFWRRQRAIAFKLARRRAA